MNSKFICACCNYKTTNKSQYNSHLLSETHICNIAQDTNINVVSNDNKISSIMKKTLSSQPKTQNNHIQTYINVFTHDKQILGIIDVNIVYNRLLEIKQNKEKISFQELIQQATVH